MTSQRNDKLPFPGPKPTGLRRVRIVKRKTIVLKGRKGSKPLIVRKGTLHEQLVVPEDQVIPARKKKAALSGAYGPLAKKRAVLAYKGALAQGRRRAVKRARRKYGRAFTEAMGNNT
jgi:hypothetical protein